MAKYGKKDEVEKTTGKRRTSSDEKKDYSKKTNSTRSNNNKNVRKSDDTSLSTRNRNVKKGRKDEVRVKQLSLDEVSEDEVLIKEIKKEPKKNNKKARNNDWLLIAGLVVVIIIGLFALKGEKVKPSYTLPLELVGNPGLQLLSYAEYQEKIDNNESFVVILSRESCSHCANFLPVAKKFAEDKKYPMYYVDTDTFSEKEWSTFETSNTFLRKKKGNWGTPTTVVLAGDEAIDYIEGETTAENVDELYNKYFKVE